MNTHKAFAASFREIQPKFPRLYTRLLSEIDITLPQFALLNQLESSGPGSMSEIGIRLQITKPAVTNLVDRLEAKGLLRRRHHPQDRRIILLEILPKGKAHIAKIQTHALKIILKAYDQFNGSEHQIINRFYDTLSKVVDNFLAKTHNEK